MNTKNVIVGNNVIFQPSHRNIWALLKYTVEDMKIQFAFQSFALYSNRNKGLYLNNGENKIMESFVGGRSFIYFFRKGH